MTSPPTAEVLTPGDLAVRLSVSDRTVRRLAEAYSKVYGQLPRDARQHRQFPLEAVLRLEQAAVLMQTAPGSSNIEILTALRDGLTPVRQLHRSAVPATPDALAPIMDELRALRAELAELRALVVTMQPEQAGRPGAPLPTPPTLSAVNPASAEPQPELTDQLAVTAPVTVVAPVPVQAVIQAPVPPQTELLKPRRIELRANHLGLLERVRAGGQLICRGQQVIELNADGGRRNLIDPRTINSLVNRNHLLERKGDNLYLTPTAMVLLNTRR